MKKQKHAAKPWSFNLRGGAYSVNAREIAETLSRKNPIAVVTLVPTDKSYDKDVLIVVHHTIQQKCLKIHGQNVREYIQSTTSGYGRCDIEECESYTSIIFCGSHAMEMVSPILNAISSIRQHGIDNHAEYTAAVNYPKV